jgi:hypothetical protein
VGRGERENEIDKKGMMIDVGKGTSQKGSKKNRTNGRETTAINNIR